MSVEAGAWATLALVREYLQLGVAETSKDSLIENLINRSYKALEAHIGRVILAATYTEYHDGENTDSLFVDNYPIISVTSLYQDVEREFGSDTLIDSDNYVVYEKEGIIRLFNEEGKFLEGVKNVKVTYQGGYASIPNDLQLASIIHVSHLLNKAGSEGHLSMGLGGLSKTFDMFQIPDSVKTLLEPYRKRPV